MGLSSTDYFENLQAEAAVEHERTRDRLQGKSTQPGSSDRAVAQVTMTKAEKARFMRLAKEHGLGLSPFIRLACDEYIRVHGWE